MHTMTRRLGSDGGGDQHDSDIYRRYTEAAVRCRRPTHPATLAQWKNVSRDGERFISRHARRAGERKRIDDLTNDDRTMPLPWARRNQSSIINS